MSRSRKKGGLPEDRNRRGPQGRTPTSPHSSNATPAAGPAVSRLATRDVYAAVVVCVLLVLAITVVFGQTFNFDFINYDDEIYVYDNPHVTAGVTAEGVAWAFSSRHSCNWHPLTWLSHMIDCELYSLHAGGHHLTNVVLHAVTAILLFLVLWRMTFSLWPSAFVAAVFAIHPLRVESVAWVAERKDVLSGLFFMLTLWAYLGYVRHRFSLTRYLSVIILFALGLMSKPILVTLPFVLLLLDYWPLGRLTAGRADKPLAASQTWRRLIVEKIPLLLLAAASCAVTIWAQKDAIERLDELPLLSRIGGALLAYASYLGQFFYPLGLAVFYPHPTTGLPAWKVVAAMLLLTGISLVALIRWRRNPYLFVGWFWYLGMLVPVIGLVQVGSQAMADRYTYLPQIGLSIALTWGAIALGQTFLATDKKPGMAGRTSLSARTTASSGPWPWGVAAALLLAALTACAWRQTSFWQNGETLWTQTLRCTGPNALTHFNLAVELMNQKRYDEAIGHYEETLQLRPRANLAHYYLGFVLERQGQTAEAIAEYKKAIEIVPALVLPHSRLGDALYQCGRFDEAVVEFQRVLQLAPKEPLAHDRLGNALRRCGRLDEAIVEFEKALEADSHSSVAHYNLANALGSKEGRSDEAIAEYEKALKIDPAFAMAHNNLGIALVSRGRLDEAIAQFRMTLEIKPNFEMARANLARALKLRNEGSPRQ
jgi:tetratricopeptide (TPR) repeat protein